MNRIIAEIFERIKSAKKCLLRGGYTQVNVQTSNKGMLLHDKLVLITGGNSGIGKAIAESFLKQNADVIIVGRNIKSLLETKKQLNSDQLFIIEGDVSTLEGVKEIYFNCEKILSHNLDILINSAGIIAKKNFEETDHEEWKSVMDANIMGTYFMCQEFLKRSRDNVKLTKIVNIGSICGILGANTPYGVSKWGVCGLTKGLARDYINHNIIVNGIAPGNVATPLNKIVPSENAYTKENAHNRIILPEEVAELALYLSSDLSNSIVGQMIAIDGGTTVI